MVRHPARRLAQSPHTNAAPSACRAYALTLLLSRLVQATKWNDLRQRNRTEAGLRACTSPNQAAGGCVVVAADAALVYYWGSGLPGRHDGWTAADVMPRAYEDVLTKHQVFVTRQPSGQVQELCLRCWVPRRETARGIEQQLEASFNPAAADTPER